MPPATPPEQPVTPTPPVPGENPPAAPVDAKPKNNKMMLVIGAVVVLVVLVAVAYFMTK
jgi:hypothetical protein